MADNSSWIQATPLSAQSATINVSNSITATDHIWTGTKGANTVLAPPAGAVGIPSFRVLVSSDIPVLLPANIASGQTVYAIGDLLFASSTTVLSRLVDIATGNALITGGTGVAPSYGKIGLTTHISGILAGDNGGTGIANTGKTITIGGNFTIIGAFTLGITITANTTVTLPTTGTLYGTAVGSITSAQLLSSLSDETGTGSVVFSANPVFTGVPLAPTAVLGTNTTQLATTAFVLANSLSNPMTTLGDIITGGVSGTPSRLAGNISVSPKFLISAGNGTVSANPSYFDLFGTNNTWTNVQRFNTQTDFYSSITLRGASGIGFYNTANTFATVMTPLALTANRTLLLQDKSGTIALVEDIKAMTVQRLTSFYTDVVATTSATDAYLYTIPANTLVANGQVIDAEYTASENGLTGTETILFYFAGIQILNTGALAPIGGADRIKVYIIRDSATTFKSHVYVQRDGAVFVSQPSQHNSGSFDPTVTNDLKFNIVSSIASVFTLTSGIIKYLP